MRFVLLPGFDGSAQLREEFCSVNPTAENIIAVSFLSNETNYPAIADRLVSEIKITESDVLIAESFSGPLALEIAKRVDLAAIIFVGSFVCLPARWLLKLLPLRLVWRTRKSEFTSSKLLCGGDGQLAARLMGALEEMSFSVFSGRIRSAIEFDGLDDLHDFSGRILVIAGTKDRLFGRHCAKRILRVCKKVDCAWIDAPHLVLETKPREVWDAIKSSIFASF